MKIAVIPDIHGHLKTLKALLKAIGPVGKNQAVVQLGDFIDRGPDSRGCAALLMSLQAKSPGRFIVLKGNHEDMLKKSENNPGVLATWIANGGSATLKSYGADFERLCRGKGAHLSWMGSLPLKWEHEGVLFCHAGLSPQNASPMEEAGLLWDRPPLVKGRFKAVVSGHSPTASGRVEYQDGVFRCDLGLGHHEPKALEYLELDLGEDFLSWQTRTA